MRAFADLYRGQAQEFPSACREGDYERHLAAAYPIHPELFGRIAEEVIQHLAGLMGSNMEITLAIHLELPGGTPDHIVRTVTENCRTLRFKAHGFEES